MSPKEEANHLVDSYRRILMDENTECGNEILCTIIAKKCALKTVDEIIKHSPNKPVEKFDPIDYFKKVKQEIKKH